MSRPEGYSEFQELIHYVGVSHHADEFPRSYIRTLRAADTALREGKPYDLTKVTGPLAFLLRERCPTFPLSSP